MEESSYQTTSRYSPTPARTVAGIATAEFAKRSTNTYYHYCPRRPRQAQQTLRSKGNLFDNYGNLWRDRTQFLRLSSLAAQMVRP